MKNLSYLNPFEANKAKVNKLQSIPERSQSKCSTGQRKSNRIKQTKQLLAQKLKEVTSFHCELQNHNQKPIMKANAQILYEQRKDWQCHLNPISKLTNQPFVRSKTCDELRKEYSLKKQRKRNSSTSKFNTPNTNSCRQDAQSTEVTLSNFKFGQKQPSTIKSDNNLSKARDQASKIQTEQFSLQPYNNLIETFDKDQIIKKLSQDVHRNKMRSKMSIQKRQLKEQKQLVDLNSKMSFPFRINTIVKKNDQVEIQSPLVLEMVFRSTESKFTPKLQRYMEDGQSDRKIQVQRKVRNSFERIKLPGQSSNRKSPKREAKTLKQSPKQRHQESPQEQEHDDSFQYSQQESAHQDSSQSVHELTQTINNSPGMEQSPRYSQNSNELLTNLQLNNTILKEKLKIKQTEIQQLSSNCLHLKTQLIHAKNINAQSGKQYQSPPDHSINASIQNKKHNSSQIKVPKYLTNLQLEIVNSIDMQNASHQITNSFEEVPQLPSPKFCDGIEEEFSRQRKLHKKRQQQPVMYQRIRTHQEPGENNNNLSRFYKKKQLFSSQISEQVSEEFDSEEIRPNKKSPHNQSRVVIKSNFYETDVQRRHSHQNKKDSLVYTLNEDFTPERIEDSDVKVTDKKQLIPSFMNSSSKKQQSHITSEQMLLESPIQRQSENLQFSSNGKLSNLSPIKSHEGQRADMSFRYLKFKTSPTMTQNSVLDESLGKFDYYLTPQKDQDHSNSKVKKQANEGLFEKAFSTLRKRKNEQSLQEQNSESGNSNSKPSFVDRIIENPFQ